MEEGLEYSPEQCCIRKQEADNTTGGFEFDWQRIHSLSVLVQGIVPEGEWDAFIKQLRTPLPTTFRINGRGKFAADLRNRLEQDFFSQFKEPVEVLLAVSP